MTRIDRAKREVYEKTNGKKTIIGILVWVAGAAAEQFIPEFAPLVREIGRLITEIGILHKIIKASKQ